MKLLIVVDRGFTQSETFLYQEILSLLEFELVVIFRKRMNRKQFPIPPTVKVINLYNNPIFRLLLKLNKDPYSFPSLIEKSIVHWVNQHKIDRVFAEYGPTSLRVLNACKKAKVPLFVRFHGFDASRLLKETNYRQRLKTLFSYAKACTPSRYIKANLVEAGYPSDHIEVIYNGIELNKFELEISQTERDEIVIIHAGRLVPKKGVPDLLQVFIKLLPTYPNLRLKIIGKGPDQVTCEEIIAKHKVEEQVSLHGALPHYKLILNLLESDIFVLNSRKDSQGETEGLPISILEAMACKVPVLSTNHAGIPEMVIHEETGILIDENDSAALETSIIRLIEDPLLRKSISEKAQVEVKKRFSSQALKDGLTGFLSS